MIIMHALLPFFLFLAQPFWELRPPEQWTNSEIDRIRTKIDAILAGRIVPASSK